MKKLKEGNAARIMQSSVREIRDKEVVVEGPDKKGNHPCAYHGPR